jgi:hypothetical protein
MGSDLSHLGLGRPALPPIRVTTTEPYVIVPFGCNVYMKVPELFMYVRLFPSQVQVPCWQNAFALQIAWPLGVN